MAVKIGSLIIRLAVEHGLLQEGLARSEREVAKTTKAIERKGKEIADFGQKLSLAVSLPLAGLAVASVKAAKESADALGQVDAALASMGNQAGRTSEQLQALASRQMGQSLYDDDQILREVTANLLTFGSVSGEQFDRAQQAALDLSTRLGTDLTSATVQIGKALNDPIKGVTALAKAGIQFTADQKAMIKSMVEAGDVAGAQKIILGELEKQFGGAAKAAREADPGAALAQSFATFQEEIGAKLLPLLPAIVDGLTGVLDAFASLPAPVQTGVVVLGAIAAVVGPIVAGLGALISAGAGTIAMLGGFPMVVSAVGLALNTLLLTPLGLAVAAVAAVVAAWYYWDDIKAIVAAVGTAVSGWWTKNVSPVLGWLADGLVSAVKWWVGLELGALRAIGNLVTGVKDWLVNKLGAIFDWVGKKTEAVSGFFHDMYMSVVGNSDVPDMVRDIGVEMNKLDQVMVEPARKATQKTEDAVRAMADRVRGILAQLYPEIEAANRKSDTIATLRDGERAGLITGGARRDAVRRAQGIDQGPLEEADKVRRAAEELGQTLIGVGATAKVQTVQIAESFRDMADKTVQAFDRMASALKGGGFLDILGAGINLFLQLGSTGLFGKTLAANINAPRIPANANGTAFHPGGLMMVGERGPEILQVPRGGRVIPNHELRDASARAAAARVTVGIDPRNGNVTAYVDSRIDRAAPTLVAGGAAVAERRFAQRATRRIG